MFGLGIVSSLYVQLPVSVAPALAQALDLCSTESVKKQTKLRGFLLECMLMWEVKFNKILY